MIIALQFCLVDVEAAFAAADTVIYPFLQIFSSSVQSTAGAVLMAAPVLAMGLFSAIGIYASTSRMMWSFARDRGLPLHQHLVKVGKTGFQGNFSMQCKDNTITAYQESITDFHDTRHHGRSHALVSHHTWVFHCS